MATPVAAYSLSAVIVPGYSGPIVELREDNGNTLQDFKFVGGVLVTDDVSEDTVADWLTANGATNAYIRTWYNQTGNTDAIQTTDAQQPPLVADTDSGGKWAASFNGIININTGHNIPSAQAIDPAPPLTLMAWAKPSTNSTRTFLAAGDVLDENAILQVSGNKWAITQSTLNSQAVAASAAGSWVHVGGEFVADNDRKLYLAGSSAGTNTTSRTVGGSAGTVLIGDRLSNNDQRMLGLLDSMLIFQEIITAEEWTDWASSRSFAPTAAGGTGRRPRIGNLTGDVIGLGGRGPSIG